MDVIVTENLTLDSTYFVAFEMAHSALKRGLRNASDLSVTQYRILVRVLGSAPNAVQQADLGVMLDLKANVVTQSVDALESREFVERRIGGEDARTRTVLVTDEGVRHVAQVNASIVEQLYTVFPTENMMYRRILEASIHAGATIDRPSSTEFSRDYPASYTLVSFERIRQATERGLRAACGASYNECRVLQRLGEVDMPLRIGDLSDQMMLSATNVARATDRLSLRGWVQRLASPNDRKAVFVSVTDEGRRQQGIIARAIDDMAREYLWSKLGPNHRQAIVQVGHTVIADLQKRREAERMASLSLLQPLERRR